MIYNIILQGVQGAPPWFSVFQRQLYITKIRENVTRPINSDSVPCSTSGDIEFEITDFPPPPLRHLCPYAGV